MVDGYHLELMQDGRFAVLSPFGNKVYEGTLDQVSDWLDNVESHEAKSEEPRAVVSESLKETRRVG